MSSKYVLHIGMPKTGTTAIQNFCSVNREALQRRGYYYPKLGNWRNHNQLPVYLLEQKNRQGKRVSGAEVISTLYRDDVFERLAKEVAGCRESILLSAEGLIRVSPSTLLEYFPKGETSIIVYIREQLEHLLSGYAQKVQGLAQETRPLGMEIAKSVRGNYPDLLAPWLEAYGRENVDVRIYPPPASESKDVRPDFLDALGIHDHTGFDFENEAVLNPSIGGSLLEFKRLINKVSPLPPAELFQRFRIPVGTLAERYPEFRSRIRIAPEFAEAFRSMYRASNAELFGGLLGGGGFREKDFTGSGWPAGSMTAEDLEKIWDELREMDPELVDIHRPLLEKELGRNVTTEPVAAFDELPLGKAVDARTERERIFGLGFQQKQPPNAPKWTLGEEACLDFRLGASGEGERELCLELDAIAFAPEALGEEQKVGVAINGKRVAEWTLVHQRRRRYSVSFAASELVQGRASIRLNFDKRLSPFELGTGADRRRLGLGIFSVRVSESKGRGMRRMMTLQGLKRFFA